MGKHAFSGRSLSEKKKVFLGTLATSWRYNRMLLFVSKQCRVVDKVNEFFDIMGTVLRKSLPGQLSELRQQVVPGVPTPLTTLDGSTNFDHSPWRCFAQHPTHVVKQHTQRVPPLTQVRGPPVPARITGARSHMSSAERNAQGRRTGEAEQAIGPCWEPTLQCLREFPRFITTREICPSYTTQNTSTP